MTAPDADPELPAKVEVLKELDPVVERLMADHEAKRDLWWPSDLIGEVEHDAPDRREDDLRKRADGIPDAARIAIALNIVTEEGLPHFHRLLATHLGEESHWQRWNNLWTAEEDRHGAVLHDYCRQSAILHARALDQLQFEYIRAGFQPQWDRDPYRVFVYTSLQERATQMSHANTGRVAGDHEPRIAYILSRIAGDEARHYAFYRTVFKEVLARDPNRALDSASRVMPAIDMPGVAMPGFKEFADVVRRIGIYGPRDYLRIVQDQIRFWNIEGLSGLNAIGRMAQERILAIPARLEKIADYVEARNKPKTFSFDLVFQRTFALE